MTAESPAKLELPGLPEACQMDWMPKGMHEKVWTCRACGQQVTRNGADGHPFVRCLRAASVAYGRGELEGVYAPRYVADGPGGMFGTDDLALARRLCSLIDPDGDDFGDGDWTITDTHDPDFDHALPPPPPPEALLGKEPK